MWLKPYGSFNGVLYLMWLEGTVDGARGRQADERTYTKQNTSSCSLALPKRSISFFDIIICVITYEAIKQTSVPISFPSASPLFLLCISPLSYHLFQCLLSVLLHPSTHLPPLLRDSRQGFNFSMLIVLLPTLCMSNTYWHSGDRQYTPQNAYFTPHVWWVCVRVCVRVQRGDEGVKCLLRRESGLSYTEENSLVPKEQKIAMLLFLTLH